MRTIPNQPVKFFADDEKESCCSPSCYATLVQDGDVITFQIENENIINILEEQLAITIQGIDVVPSDVNTPNGVFIVNPPSAPNTEYAIASPTSWSTSSIFNGIAPTDLPYTIYVKNTITGRFMNFPAYMYAKANCSVYSSSTLQSIITDSETLNLKFRSYQNCTLQNFI